MSQLTINDMICGTYLLSPDEKSVLFMYNDHDFSH